jgi:hypothetical protein
MTNQKSIIFSSLDLPTRQLMSTPIWMLFPKELSQVSLIRELSFIVQYGTSGVWLCILLTAMDEWGSNIQLSSLPFISYNFFFQAYPDVAAQGDNFKIFLEGEAILIGGTSCASPTFTGFVSLLNDARLNAGLPSLGFLNPFLYSKGFAGLNDITIGHNSGCGTQGFNVSQPYV